MRYLYHFTRIIFGITFIFSGFVKGIDPWGSAYKFTDYFNAMGLEWFVWASFPLGILFAFTEFSIGVAFLFNWRIRFFSWLGLLFMGFFLPLTLWIAVKNPVTDCGCFGDALVITNWETFYKNVLLIIFAFIVFKYRKQNQNSGYKKYSFIFSGISFLFYFVMVFYSFNHLPILDFRPFKVGVNIPDAMSTPVDAQKEIYENIFYYEEISTGKVKKFSENNYPWKDTVNWKYNKMESILIQKGYEPPIHDFVIESPDGENIVDFFIYDENYVFMLVAYDLNKSKIKTQNNINELANWAMENEMSFICLTSTLSDESMAFADETGAPYEFLNCDEITLKTMIRSNPGLLVVKDGNILGKWHYNDIPTPEEFRKEFMNE